MKVLQELRAAGRGQDMQAVVEMIPYARFLGIQVDQKGNEITTIMPFKQALVGNVNLPALHGGVIGAFLEMTAVIQLLFDTSCERLPKTIDVSIQFPHEQPPPPSGTISIPLAGTTLIQQLGRRLIQDDTLSEDRSHMARRLDSPRYTRALPAPT